MHHLFHAVKSSTLAANIVDDLADRWTRLSEKPWYLDQMRTAMQQKTSGEVLHGYTPLHFFCHDSDINYRKANLADSLLRSGAVFISEFDYVNDQVSAFCLALPP